MNHKAYTEISLWWKAIRIHLQQHPKRTPPRCVIHFDELAPYSNVYGSWDLGIYSCTLVALVDGAMPLHKIARSDHGYHWSSTPPRFEHFRLAQGACSCGATAWEQRHMYNISSKENFITSFLNDRKEWPRSRYTSRFYDIMDYEFMSPVVRQIHRPSARFPCFPSFLSVFNRRLFEPIEDHGLCFNSFFFSDDVEQRSSQLSIGSSARQRCLLSAASSSRETNPLSIKAVAILGPRWSDHVILLAFRLEAAPQRRTTKLLNPYDFRLDIS